MAKFNPAKYDPKTDSSSGTDRMRHNGPATVILDWTSIRTKATQDAPATDVKVCPCGCREPLASKSRFRMGHDARLKGILSRAHVTATDITLVKGSDLTVVSAVALASQFTSPNMDWVKALREAEARFGGATKAKVQEANDAIVAEANGPQVGTRKLIKVGRWNYTGEMIAVYEDKGVAVFQYASKSGEVKTVERPLEDVQAMADAPVLSLVPNTEA